VAEWVGGEVVGDGDVRLTRPTALSDAGPGDLTFVDGDKNRKAWAACRASAAVVPQSFPNDPRPLIKVADPLATFLKIVLHFRGERPELPREIHPTAVVHPSAELGPNAHVGPHAVIGERTRIGANATIHAGVVIGRFCLIGDDVTLYPHVVLYDDCTLGNRVILHAHAVIGADGFGYRMVNGRHEKIPQVGSVEIADDVEIGASTTVDRGTVGPTRIGLGTKIDNQVMVAHNCQLGPHNILISQVGLAGSCTTGAYVVMAGQVGLADHVHVGDRAILGAQCGVIQDIPADAKMLGSPSMPGSEYLRCVANWQKLPELRKDVARIKKHLKLDEASG
jgi:UDP-3-O-[3-hydroxymyristoyl] glucosamine N-acyltransferase